MKSSISSTRRRQLVFQRHPAVRLRRESWGGFAFQRDIGDLLELDQQGFDVLAALSEARDLRGLRAAVSAHGCPPRLPELARFVGQLERCRFVQHVSSTAVSPCRAADSHPTSVPRRRRPEDNPTSSLRAPLVAHWAVTYRCNLACAFCYSDSGPQREREPAAEIRQRIVSRLAEWGVFEVALGGGEPTMLPDFPELLAAIRSRGMVPNVTTNGLSHSGKVLEALTDHAGTVHLSADGPELLDAARGHGVFARLQKTARQLTARGVQWGVNLLLNPDNARSLDRSLAQMQDLGAAAVTLLPPKGSWAHRCWPGFPSTEDIRLISSSVKRFIERQPDLRLYVHTSLRGEWSQVGLLEDPEPEVLGCGGGQRHVAVTPTGDVYPCSHACWSELRMGNLLMDVCQNLWLAGRGQAARQEFARLCRGTACPCRDAAVSPDVQQVGSRETTVG